MPQRMMTIDELIAFIPQANFAWNGTKGGGLWWSTSEPDMKAPLGWGKTNAQYCHGLVLAIGPGELVNLITRTDKETVA